jgi:maltoporin
MTRRLSGIALAVALSAWAWTAQAVELSGYMRQGVGGNSKGGNQVAFQNAGQDFKLRLGNEDNWSEFLFSQTVQKDKNSVEWGVAFMLGWGNGFTEEPDLKLIALQQEYVWATFKGARVWAGKRFYHRSANDMFDYFYMAENARGAGIEDVDVGFGKFALQVSRFQPSITQNGQQSTVQGLSFWMPDVRLEGIPITPKGTLDLAALARIRTWNENLQGGPTPAGSESYSPFVMAKYVQGGILNGENVLAATYKTGCFLDNDCNKERRKLTVSEELNLHPVQNFQLDFAAIYMRDQVPAVTTGTAWVKHTKQQLGVGVRPFLKLGDHFGVKGDLGYFWNKSDAGTDAQKQANTMMKGTIAPVITPYLGIGGLSIRPEIRFFVTYATWNKEQNGTTGIANGTFGPDATSGFTFGTQVETWF